MSLRRAVIVDVCRSPFARGRENGALAPVHPVDLYAQVLAALVARTGIDPALVEDVITGCVIQVAEQAGGRLWFQAYILKDRSFTFRLIERARVAGYEAVTMQALFAPARTPEAIVRALNQETLRVINALELREKFSAAATEVVGGTPDQLRAAVAEDMSKLERVIKAAGMRAL
jgi:hypothetical protein